MFTLVVTLIIISTAYMALYGPFMRLLCVTRGSVQRTHLHGVTAQSAGLKRPSVGSRSLEFVKSAKHTDIGCVEASTAEICVSKKSNCDAMRIGHA